MVKRFTVIFAVLPLVGAVHGTMIPVAEDAVKPIGEDQALWLDLPKLQPLPLPLLSTEKQTPQAPPAFKVDVTYPYPDGFSVREKTVLDRWEGERTDFVGVAIENNPFSPKLHGQVVPEPLSLLPMLIGAAALIRRRRRA